MSEEAARRAQARASWPIARYRLGEEPDEDLSGVTTAAQRLTMMWELARTAWELSGREIPAYDRRHAPGRVVRPGP